MDHLNRIGFIGLGLMGEPMALNLLHSGYSVTVFNRSRKPMDELAPIGAKTANSPKEVAGNSGVVIDMVTDAPDVHEVILGQDSVACGGHAGLIVIDMSTNSPKTALSISTELSKNGRVFFPRIIRRDFRSGFKAAHIRKGSQVRHATRRTTPLDTSRQQHGMPSLRCRCVLPVWKIGEQ